ncbi:carboxypeptidase-like regulatory domain-containing protein [Riemerella anatipestifer]|uniref:carboxypeptidase-like regulatory domain-containing protein n=1 Tax=Riemerella anatipestifer TaxID=34085 RepID=UPI000AAE3CCD|nr:carboxypeptidase-like regulatory domain-containing protein [Riemerella anatipestifer]
MRKFWLLLMVLASNIYFSQTVTGNILSKDDGLPIRYAKIGVEDIEKGGFSDDKGFFLIDLTNVDRNANIKIEAAGFEPYKNTVADFIKSHTKVILAPKTTEIQEVLIASKKYITKNIGYHSKSRKIFLNYLSIDSKTLVQAEKEKPQAEIAVPIQVKHKSKITKINLNLAQFNVNKAIPARFIIYSELDGKPHHILNKEDLIFEISSENLKDNTFSLEVSDKNIWFSGKIFVGFQPLDRNFTGSFSISAGLFGRSFMRSFVEKWRKLPASIVPAINLEIKTEK